MVTAINCDFSLAIFIGNIINSFTKTMGLMGFIEALRLKKEGIISIISNQGAVSNELFKENLIF